MRHDAMELGIAAALAKRGNRRLSRGQRLRAAARSLAADLDVAAIDEAFAGFTRIDAPVANDDDQHGENDGKFPSRLTECLSAQLDALDQQRSELVQLLRRIDQESQVL
jgi:hypothetical protein